jgi:phosphate uptake regulator
MEYRKLIKFGNSSFIVSLPKTWVNRHNLKKGDPIHLDVNGTGELMISPKIIEPTKEKKSITIDTDNKDLHYLQREIVSAYICNFHNIVLVGEQLMGKASEIREVLNELVALEIMEQTSKRISAKDFLDMDNISIENIIRKIDMIVRSTIFDIKTLAEEKKKSSEIAYARDKDINRLTILALRTIRYGIDSATFMNKNKLKPHELLQLNQLATYLEKTADEAKRIAKLFDHMIDDHLKTSEEIVFYNHLLSCFVEVEDMYVQVMKAYYKKDRYQAFELAKKRIFLKEKLDELSMQAVMQKKSNKILEKISSMLTNIHYINRVSYEL